MCFFVKGYLLLGLISSLVFRAIRDALPHDPVAQERILGASLMALAIADVSALVFLGLVSHINAAYLRLHSKLLQMHSSRVSR